MKYEVKYHTISWSTKAKREAHEVVVIAKSANEAIGKVLKKTKGHGINFRVQEVSSD